MGFWSPVCSYGNSYKIFNIQQRIFSSVHFVRLSISLRPFRPCVAMGGPDPQPPGMTEAEAAVPSSDSSTTRRTRGNSAAIFGGGSRGETSSARMGLYGAISSCAAGVFLQPLDIIKTRQVLPVPVHLTVTSLPSGLQRMTMLVECAQCHFRCRHIL